MPRLTQHQRIMRAAFGGTGVRLSAQDAHELSRDDAISTAATNDCERDGRCDGCYRVRCICERAD